MPPLLVALGIVAVIAMIPRRNKVPGSPVVVQTTPATSPPGITTGFAQPPIQTSLPSESAPPLQANMPNASQSGVPSWSSNAQEFNTAPYGYAPAPSTRIPGFYAGPISAQLNPRHRPTPVPQGKSSSCGCGGSCGGGCQTPSSCAISKGRNNDAGCLAPTQASLLRSTSSGVLATWAANLASAGVNGWNTAQQVSFDVQNENPQGSDVTVPAAPNLTGIGLSNMRPLRSAIG